MKVTTSLLALVMVLLSGKVNYISSVNVTRLQNDDKFTNPNHTAVSSTGSPDVLLTDEIDL